jgi:hypothetical protein
MKNTQRRVSEQFADSEFVRNRTPQKVRDFGGEEKPQQQTDGSDKKADDTDHEILAQEFKQQILNEATMMNRGGGGVPAAEPGEGDDLLTQGRAAEALKVAALMEAKERRAFEEISALAAKELAAELDQQEQEEAQFAKLAAEIARDADKKEYEAAREKEELEAAIANSVASSLAEERKEKVEHVKGSARESSKTEYPSTTMGAQSDGADGSGLSTMSVKELKAVATAYGIDTSSCTEKVCCPYG